MLIRYICPMQKTPIEQVQDYIAATGDFTGVVLCLGLREGERAFMGEFLAWYRRNPHLSELASDDVVMLYMRTIHAQEAN